MSVAGGLHKAFDHAEAAGCTALQVFVKNQRQWRAPPLTDEQIALFRSDPRRKTVEPIVAHAAYLINLACPDNEVWQKSVAGLAEEAGRCHQLGIALLVVHPGAHTNAGESAGIARAVEGLDAVIESAGECDTRILLEVAAGQGSSIGHRFEHLADIWGRVKQPNRLGICLDTCHLLAAGYDLVSPDGYENTMSELSRRIGVKRVCCIHVNDSKRELGSRVDRHEHIGKGCIGRAGFRNLLRDPRFAKVPHILETPKGTDSQGRDWDRVNLAALRRFGR